MKKLLKKLSALGLCGVMAFTAVVSAGAAETDSDISEATANPSFKLLSDKIEISNDQIYVSGYNVPTDSVFGVEYRGEDKTTYAVNFSEVIKSGKRINLVKNKKYEFWLRNGTGGGSDGSFRSYGKTGGTYKKVRIKLSDFCSDFNSDGSQTESVGEYGPHNFKFGPVEKTGNGTFYGGMCVRSGAAVTSVSPNKNGEIEFYVSTKIGDESKICTDFRYEYKLPNGATAVGSGGGSTGTYIHGLRIGDADSDSMLTISDVTKIQFVIARLDTLNSLQKFTADVNSDGKTNIVDATTLQMHLAEI